MIVRVKKSLLFLLPVLLAGLFMIKPVWAVDIGGVATTYVVADPKAVDGDIVINSPTGLLLTTLPYDKNIVGILSDVPVAVVHTGVSGSKPIVSSGIATVNVTNVNGAIKAGDFITSSTIAGKGQKADRSGYVVGTALADYSSANATTVGKIPVSIRVEYAELTTARNANRIFEYLGASLFSNIQNPEKFGALVRYFLAGIILLAAFGFGFVTFSRSLPRAIEAIGRNPLARSTIYLSMLLNVGLIAVVGIIGIVGALLILRL